MPTGCSICQRPDVQTLNEALAHGEAVRGVARRYKIAKTTLVRHARHVQHAPQKETPAMEPMTVEPVDTFEAEAATLRAELAELHTQLARTQAQLAGINREFAAWRDEQSAQRTQCAADHALAEQLRACLQVLQTDDTAWHVVELLLRADGHNGKGPLLQALRRLIGRRVLTGNDY
jgi:hypothetical protein